MTTLQQTDCFSKNMKVWIFLGIYPLKNNWKLYSLYSTIFISFFIFLYDGLLSINFYYIPGDLNVFVDEMIFYFTFLSIVSKVLTFLKMKDKIRDILIFLDSNKFQAKTEKELEIIIATKKFIVRYWKLLAIFSYFSNMIHIFSPLLIHLLLSAPMVLPVSGYLFLSEDFRTKYIYYLYFYQAIGIHVNMVYNVSIDPFFLGLIVLVIAQLDILDDKLKNITAIKLEESDDGRSLDIDEICIKKLNECIVHYNNISKFCQLVEDVFSVTLFVQFGMASCIICICLFRLTLPAPVQYYFFLGSYSFIMLLQIMVPCFFGTRIMEKSNNLSHAVYVCDWTPRSRRFKSSMRLFVERAYRPHSITGWKMFPLSLVTFTSIMNSAYSFFTLLKHMQSNET